MQFNQIPSVAEYVSRILMGTMQVLDNCRKFLNLYLSWGCNK